MATILIIEILHAKMSRKRLRIFAKKTVVADVGFIPTTVPTVQSAVLTVADNGTSLGTITAPTTSTINKELLAGLTAKDFAVGDSLTVTVSQTSSAGAGLIVLYLRELP